MARLQVQFRGVVIKHTGSMYTGSMYTGSMHTGSMYTGSMHTGSMDIGSMHTGSMDIAVEVCSSIMTLRLKEIETVWTGPERTL